MVLTLALFAQIATACAPGNAVRTLESVAKVESGLNPLAIHDNTTGVSYSPATRDEAESIASDLILVRGHSVDLGLMQINSATAGRLSLPIPDAFDACRSISAGAAVLREGYQRALRTAFSLYNTGSPTAGIRNGYADRVEAAASALPAIGGGQLAATPPVAVPDPVPESCAPSWDVWMVATCSDKATVQPGSAPARGVTSVSLNSSGTYTHADAD